MLRGEAVVKPDPTSAYGLSRMLWVDLNTTVDPAIQDGSIKRPFDDIQAAIDKAVTVAATGNWQIRIQSGDYSAQTLAIPENIDFLIEGPIRRGEGVCTIGPINWTVTGSSTSRLGLRNLGVKGAITVIDGTATATNAILTVEGCQIGASAGGNAITQTGTSVVTATLAGSSLASFEGVSTPIVNTVLAGDVDIDASASSILLLHNVQFRTLANFVRAGSILASGCGILDAVAFTCSGTACQFLNSRFVGASSITFSGAAGIATLDGISNFSFYEEGGTIVNGTKNGTSLFSAGLAVEVVKAALLPRFQSSSPFLCLVLGDQTDSDYSGIGNGAMYAGARRGTPGSPPVNAPYVGMSQWDYGAPYAGVLDTGRTIYYGGGGWLAPDAHNHQFYTAPGPYTETTDTGVVCLHLGHAGAAVGPFASVGAAGVVAGGRFQVIGSNNGIGVDQRTAGTRNLIAGSLAINERFNLTGDITPAALGVGPTQNYNPSGFSTATILRQDMSASGSIGGLVPGASPGSDQRVVVVHNLDTVFTLTLNHEDAGSTAANRLSLPSSANLVINPLDSVTLWYDTVAARWKVAA